MTSFNVDVNDQLRLYSSSSFLFVLNHLLNFEMVCYLDRV